MKFTVTDVITIIAFILASVVLWLSYLDKIDFHKTTRQLMMIIFGLSFLLIGVYKYFSENSDHTLSYCIIGGLFTIDGLIWLLYKRNKK